MLKAHTACNTITHNIWLNALTIKIHRCKWNSINNINGYIYSINIKQTTTNGCIHFFITSHIQWTIDKYSRNTKNPSYGGIMMSRSDVWVDRIQLGFWGIKVWNITHGNIITRYNRIQGLSVIGMEPPTSMI